MMDYLIPAFGGFLIGVAALILMAFLGRIAGISGITWGAISGLFNKTAEEAISWRWLFIAGLLLGPVIVHYVFGMAIPAAPSGGLTLAIVSGLLVGFGVKLGSGCTSGHGVCGIGRLSIRSITATMTFMVAGIVTVYLLKHVFA